MIFPYEFAAYGTGAIIQSDIRPMALVIGLFLCPVVNIENIGLRPD